MTETVARHGARAPPAPKGGSRGSCWRSDETTPTRRLGRLDGGLRAGGIVDAEQHHPQGLDPPVPREGLHGGVQAAVGPGGPGGECAGVGLEHALHRGRERGVQPFRGGAPGRPGGEDADLPRAGKGDVEPTSLFRYGMLEGNDARLGGDIEDVVRLLAGPLPEGGGVPGEGGGKDREGGAVRGRGEVPAGDGPAEPILPARRRPLGGSGEGGEHAPVGPEPREHPAARHVEVGGGDDGKGGLEQAASVRRRSGSGQQPDDAAAAPVLDDPVVDGLPDGHGKGARSQWESSPDAEAAFRSGSRQRDPTPCRPPAPGPHAPGTGAPRGGPRPRKGNGPCGPEARPLRRGKAL